MDLFKATENPDRFARRRHEMVERQLVFRGIRDDRVLDVMRAVPRHLFVEEAFQDERAYGDSPLPIGEGQTISQPFMVAIMTELLELKGAEKVLEVGTGSGYQAAVLGLLAEQVYSIERIPALLIKARRVIESLGYRNIALRVSDGTLGWKDFAPYNAIVVTAGGPEVPQPLLDQLEMGGRLVIPVGNEVTQVLHRIVKTRTGYRDSEHSMCTFVKLVGQYGWQEMQVK